MRIAYITAGAAGSFCGSCMRDNTLTAALHRRGHDALLIPLYTPIRTDEENVSNERVFFGALNVYLQEKLGFFRRTPWFFDRLLDAPGLLRWVGRFAGKTQASELGDLTLSILRGEHGHQKKEFVKLLEWLKSDVKPDLIVLTNVLLSGLIPPLKEEIPVPIVGTLQGDDIYLDALPQPIRDQAIALIRENCSGCDRFIATCTAYADFMAGYLGLPREKIDVVYPGITLKGYGPLANTEPADRPFTIGYFARICPEKGFHLLVDAYIELRKRMPDRPVRLRASGYLGPANHAYLRAQESKLNGFGGDYAHVDCPSHLDKQQFFRDIDVLSVPTVYVEPKGLYVLEAWASGVPVVQPRHGSFPELIERTGGGMLAEPGDVVGHAAALEHLARNPDERRAMGARGRSGVERHFHDGAMAETTERIFQTLVAPRS
jgi:glycosyltransferase involved in cell wall biosynthesis